MTASFRAELLRLRRWPAAWVLAGAWIVLNLTFGYLFNYLSYTGEGDAAFGPEGGVASELLAEMMPDNSPVVLVQGMPMFGGALVMILGALAVGSGYGWRTWKTVFTVGPSRLNALGGTICALAVVLVGLVVTTFALDLGAATLIASVESQSVVMPSFGAVVEGLGNGLLITGMWTAAGVLLGTLARGPALAIGLGLVWALVVENLLRGVSSLLGPLETVTDALPGTAAGSLVGAMGARTEGDADGTPGVLTILDGGTAAIALGAYLAAFLIATAFLTKRRDIA